MEKYARNLVLKKTMTMDTEVMSEAEQKEKKNYRAKETCNMEVIETEKAPIVEKSVQERFLERFDFGTTHCKDVIKEIDSLEVITKRDCISYY